MPPVMIYTHQFQLIGMEAAQKILLLHRCASFVAKIRTMVLIFPAELARTEDPGLNLAREAAEVLPAESVRCNGNQHFFITNEILFLLNDRKAIYYPESTI